MRIAYVTHTRFPTEKAHGHQVAHVCKAVSDLGHDVTLLAPDLPTGIRQDAFTYYRLPKIFTLRKLHAFDALNHPLIPGFFAFLVSMRSYRKSLKKFFAKNKFDLLYARSPIIASALLAFGMPVVLELHTLPKRGRSGFVKLCNRCRLVICLTSPMRDELLSWGVEKKFLMVEPDAVDLERFKKIPSSREAKRKFHLPDDRPVIGYVGSLVTFDNLQKGVKILVDALSRLKKQGVPVFGFIVGDPAKWRKRYKHHAYEVGLSDDDIIFHDAIPSHRVAEALAACDVLVYPAPEPKHAFFRRDTSPLKLFEYLASGVPAVCADIPPIRDVVDKTTVRFVHPGSETSLAGAIKDVLEHPREASVRATKGELAVGEHTWKKRMQRILKHVSS